MHLYINVMQAMCKELHYPSCRYETATVIGAADPGAEGLWIDFKFPDLIHKPPERYYWKADNCEDSFLIDWEIVHQNGN